MARLWDRPGGLSYYWFGFTTGSVTMLLTNESCAIVSWANGSDTTPGFKCNSTLKFPTEPGSKVAEITSAVLPPAWELTELSGVVTGPPTGNFTPVEMNGVLSPFSTGQPSPVAKTISNSPDTAGFACVTRLLATLAQQSRVPMAVITTVALALALAA